MGQKESGLTPSIIKPHDNIIGVDRVDYYDDRYYRVSYKEAKKIIEVMLDSVTSVLGAFPKDFLANWRGDVGNARADQIVAESTRMGSFVHWAAEVMCRKGVVVYNPSSSNFYTEKKLTKIEKKYKELVVVRYQKEWVQIRRIYLLLKELASPYMETEKKVFSLKHGYAGTLDLLLELAGGSYNISGAIPITLNEGLYLLDWKSGKTISETHFMQQAAYLEAVIEMTPELDKHIKGILVIHTNAKTKSGIEGLQTYFKNRTECKKYFKHFKAVQAVYNISNPAPNPKEFTMSTMFQLDMKRGAKVK